MASRRREGDERHRERRRVDGVEVDVQVLRRRWRREGSRPHTHRRTQTHTGQKSGILAFWGWDRATLEADTDIIATINRDDVPDCCSGAGPFVVLGQNAGKISRDDAGLLLV